MNQLIWEFIRMFVISSGLLFACISISANRPIIARLPAPASNSSRLIGIYVYWTVIWAPFKDIKHDIDSNVIEIHMTFHS